MVFYSDLIKIEMCQFAFYIENKVMSKFHYPRHKKAKFETNNSHFQYFYNIIKE